ncbi:MAG TPA: bifunctional phosphoglucose/phosphomannose isomerase [Nevskiaceae bacterium]|nr:bifunctional phosphoglucose/phosphomannose isomerase [Nevskiaceae bacterium]
MLDDLKYIHEKDAADALGIAERQCAQLTQAISLANDKQFNGVANIVFAGMGGSSLAALLLHTWPTITLPFEIVREYDIPPYVDGKTLFIASSYSGNTEETLSALEQAEAKGAQIAIIAAGGKLQQVAEQKGYVLALLPKAEQPRYAVLSSLRASLEVLAKAGVVKMDDLVPQMEQAAGFLKTEVQKWRAEVPTANNPAKQLAQELMGKSVVVYGGPKMFPAAYKWKISCNENAKHIAWTNQIPEFNHNEFIGWSKQPVDKPYAVVDLRSSLEHPRVQKRFEVSARLLSGMRPEPIVVNAQGQGVLQHLLWTVAYGDFVTLYLALLNGLNPAPVELVEKFKKALDE